MAHSQPPSSQGLSATKFSIDEVPHFDPFRANLDRVGANEKGPGQAPGPVSVTRMDQLSVPGAVAEGFGAAVAAGAGAGADAGWAADFDLLPDKGSSWR